MARVTPIQRASTASSEVTINLRAQKNDRDLIDRAAAITHKTRTAFMLDSARLAAVDTLLDQRFFGLDAARWDSFVAALDAPPAVNPGLTALMRRTAPWET